MFRGRFNSVNVGNRRTLQDQPTAARRTIEAHVTVAADKNRKAIQVVGEEIWYFSLQKTTSLCTCRQHQAVEGLLDIDRGAIGMAETNAPNVSHETPRPVRVFDSGGDIVMSVDVNIPIDGYYPDIKANDSTKTIKNEHEQIIYPEPDDVTSLGVAEVRGDTVQRRDFGAGAKCAVCCRSGYSGGYKLVGYDRRVLDYYALSTANGYTEDRSTYPYSWMDTTLPGSYVEWALTIPRYFYSVFYGVYNNYVLLQNFRLSLVAADGTVHDLSMETLQALAGTEVHVRVDQAVRVTHAVFCFQTTKQPVYAELPIDPMADNSELFLARPQATANVSVDVPSPQDGDFILRYSDKTFWRVGDRTTIGMSRQHPTGYTLNIDVVQPEHTDYTSLFALYRV